MGDQHGTLDARRRFRCALRVVAASAGVALAATQGAEAVAPQGLDWVVSGAGRGTPVADGYSVYFLTRTHEVVALALETGAERWRRPTGGLGTDTLGSRVVLSGDVVVAADTDLIAFDRRTGELRWRFGAGERRNPGLYLGDTSNGAVFAGSTAGFLQAVNIENGRALWSHALTTGTVFTPAAVGSGMVVAGFADRAIPRRGGVAAFDAGTGELFWKRTFLPWTHVGAHSGAAGVPAVCGAVIVLGSEEGSLYGVDPAGGQIRWVIPPLDARADRGRPPAQDYRPVVCAGNTLVAGSLTGQVLAFDLDTRRERWRSAPLAASVAFGLAADDECAFVPYLSGHLLALALKDGAERWRTGGPAEGLVWTPLVQGARLLVAGSGAGFMAFRR